MKSDPNPIHEFCLKSERNLRIAAAVGDAWPEARDKLVAGFLDRLGSVLTKKLKGWKFEPWNRFFIDADANWCVWKPAWEDQYYVTLHCGNRGQQMIFGVMRAEQEIGKRSFCAELLAAVRKNHPSARSRYWWEAVTNMQSPASDWRKPEVLWRMHKDDEFLQEVAAQLLDVVKVSERIVDRLARK